MNGINEKLNELFSRWHSYAHCNGDCDFVFDGLMNDASFVDDDWWNSRLRILCISKDPYFQNIHHNEEGVLDGEDYREYDLLQMSLGNRFWRNILTMVYGLVNTNEVSYPSYEIASTYQSREYVTNNIPFALINIKKQKGESTVSNNVLHRYARIYCEYLHAEVRDILCPNVIYCCGTSGIVMDEIYSDVNFKQIDKDGFIFYSEDAKILLIAGFHPKARRSNHEMYELVMQAYSDFLEDFDFPNK